MIRLSYLKIKTSFGDLARKYYHKDLNYFRPEPGLRQALERLWVSTLICDKKLLVTRKGFYWDASQCWWWRFFHAPVQQPTLYVRIFKTKWHEFRNSPKSKCQYSWKEHNMIFIFIICYCICLYYIYLCHTLIKLSTIWAKNALGTRLALPTVSECESSHFQVGVVKCLFLLLNKQFMFFSGNLTNN